MCHLARHQQAPLVDATEPIGSPPSRWLRPRWAAAGAAAILASVAAASLLDRPASQAAAQPAPAAGMTEPATSALVPPASSADHSPPAPDDGVPVSSGTSKASLGDCHHGA